MEGSRSFTFKRCSEHFPLRSVDSFLEKHACGGTLAFEEKHELKRRPLFLPEPARGEAWVFDPSFSHPRYRACPPCIAATHM